MPKAIEQRKLEVRLTHKELADQSMIIYFQRDKKEKALLTNSQEFAMNANNTNKLGCKREKASHIEAPSRRW